MYKRKSSVIAEEMKTLQTELNGLDDSNEDSVTRSAAIGDEFEALQTEYDEAVGHETKIEAVRSASLAASNRETAGRRTPELKRTVDPYEGLELVRAGAVPMTDMISRAMAAVEQAPKHLSDDSREKMVQLLEMGGRQAPLIARHMLMTGSEQYHREFEEYIQSRGTYSGEALRAALSLTGSAGGFLVPMTLDPSIILTNAGIQGSIRSISTIKTIATDDWNGVTSAGVTAEWLGEGVQAADASPTFVQPIITPKKAAAWVFGSYEVLADSGFATELQMLLADAKVRLEEAAFATGNTGATIPRGVVAATAAVTASIVTAAATNAFAIGDVYNVSDALRPRDAANASWIANKKLYTLIRRFDTSGGGSFWANIGMSRPALLIGQPQYECSTMSAVISTGANVLLAGNFQQYYIVDRVGMSVMYEPMVKSTGNGRPTGQAGWFAFWRVGADVVDADAFRLLQLNTVAANTPLA